MKESTKFWGENSHFKWAPLKWSANTRKVSISVTKEEEPKANRDYQTVSFILETHRNRKQLMKRRFHGTLELRHVSKMLLNEINFHPNVLSFDHHCVEASHWGKNSQFIQNSHFESLIFHKIHNIKISFLPKFTISKSHFSQNSQFQNLIFHKIHIFKVSLFTFCYKRGSLRSLKEFISTTRHLAVIYCIIKPNILLTL